MWLEGVSSLNDTDNIPKQQFELDKGDDLAERFRPEKMCVPIEMGMPIKVQTGPVPEIMDKDEYNEAQQPSPNDMSTKDQTQ